MRYSTPELVEVGKALATVLGGMQNEPQDNTSPFDKTLGAEFEIN
jgi:hypothetical protein